MKSAQGMKNRNCWAIFCLFAAGVCQAHDLSNQIIFTGNIMESTCLLSDGGTLSPCVAAARPSTKTEVLRRPSQANDPALLAYALSRTPRANIKLMTVVYP
jgi:hypothetical protein